MSRPVRRTHLTPKEREGVIAAIRRTGSALAAARECGVNYKTASRLRGEALPDTVNPSPEIQAEVLEVWERSGRCRKTAADRLGWAPIYFNQVLGVTLALLREESVGGRAHDGFVVREQTTAYDADDQVTGSWVREGPQVSTAPGGEDAGEARDGHGAYQIKGVSTLYDAEGNQRAQWVKTSLDQERRLEGLRVAAAAMSETLPRLAPLAAPAETVGHLCNLYTLTDCHVGMLAWHKEGGADWDVKIAERTLVDCFAQMIVSAPPARLAVVNQLGDFLHYDSLVAVTPTSGHHLDADGRFSKMVAAAIRILRRVVDLALQRHAEVRLVLAEGNHDIASSVWLRQMFKALYEHEPRVSVDDSELPYYVVQHGRTMLCLHHGHLTKKANLPLLFAAQFPVIWGATTKRYAHTGHEHHVHAKEHSGITVLQHPTLAARDAYAARGGWISERQATAITYHSAFGEVGRTTVTPEMLDAGDSHT